MEMTRTFITRTFADIISSFEDFQNLLLSDINFTMNENERKDLFLLLFSKYADSHVRYTNEMLFIINIQKEIKMHYPTVLAMIRDQKKMRDTSDAEFAKGGKVIVNSGAHNTALVSLDMTDGIQQLDAQQINHYKRAEIDILMQRMDAYRSDMEERFLNRFIRYFVQIIYPQKDLLYITDNGEGNE